MQQAQALYVAHKSNKSQTDIAPTTQNDPIVAEWETLRATSEAKIKNNELMIGELKLQMKRIATLERHNRDLQIRLDTYQQSKGDWEIFRRAFTSDMEELRKGLKELTLDRKK